ncbi:MAG: hypothetical protein HY930_01885 [Euryarchaeota archaeon]|nr:hypothetical protein [Euryarchaeota archaeon]
MNEYKLTAIAIWIILGLGFVFLINFGVAQVTYFGISIILLSLVGSVVYTWWKTQSDKTVDKLKAEILLKIKKDYADGQKLIAEAGEMVNVDNVRRDLESLRSNLINLKFYDADFNTTEEAKKYTLTVIEQENRRVEQRLRSLEALAAIEVKPKLDEYIQELRVKLDKLRKAGYKIGEEVENFETIEAQESKTLREMLEKKKKLTEKFVSILNKCAAEAGEILTTSQRYGVIKIVEHALLKIKTEDFDGCVILLVDARSRLKDFLKDFFAIEKNEFSASVEGIYKLLDGEQVEPEKMREIEELRSWVLYISDPGTIGELQDLKVQFKNAVASTIAELHEKLRSLEEEIKAYAPSREIWTSDELAEPLVRRVSAEDELRVFTRYATNALEHIGKQLAKDSAFIKILKNYDKVEQIISKKLEGEGKLSATALNVKYPEKFLMLYSKKHPDTEYTESTATLRVKARV